MANQMTSQHFQSLSGDGGSLYGFIDKIKGMVVLEHLTQSTCLRWMNMALSARVMSCSILRYDIDGRNLPSSSGDIYGMKKR